MEAGLGDILRKNARERDSDALARVLRRASGTLLSMLDRGHASK